MSSDYTSLLDFTGQVAIITGAAQGLGAEFSKAFTQCGARVVLLDLDQDAVAATAEAIGVNAAAMQCDVRDRSRVEHCVAEVTR